MTASDATVQRCNVTCPFCGLACDDLTVRIEDGAPQVVANGCRISVAAFSASKVDDPGDLLPKVAGIPADLQRAIAAAAEVLRRAKQPVFGGLGTDVQGMRALMQLADACGAVVDHMNSTAKLRNILAFQDGGWVTTTLTEVKNHADLIVCVGTDVVTKFPRFFERFVWNRETLFGSDPWAREVIYLGQAEKLDAGNSPDGRQPTRIPCANEDLPQVLAMLRAVSSEQSLQASTAGGVAIELLRDLAGRIKRAKYPVFVWVAPDLSFPHAELAVQCLVELIKDLSRDQRCAGLPLGGTDGDFTVNQVHTWQTGFAFRTSLASGAPDYDPYHYSAARMLREQEADMLLWISSFDERRAPPECSVATIVLGRPGMKFVKPPDVYIPVGTPGIDHSGHFFRADKVVALPLRQLRETLLLTVAQVLAQLEGALRQ
jgi:formylmethanofuran dehydrogenase subunit B